MLIDWFTVGAQVLNFLILVWLLKRFLYKPILDAIDSRERIIAKKLADAEETKVQACSERDNYLYKNKAFEQQRDALMQEAIDEASNEKHRLYTEARQEADDMRKARLNTLLQEQKNINADINRITREEIFLIVRKVLKDLSGTDIEARMSEVFIERLSALDQSTRNSLNESLRDAKNQVIVRSAFELSMPQRAAIKAVLDKVLSSQLQIRFETADEIVSGIEIIIHGQKIAWSIADYTLALEKRVSELLVEPPTLGAGKGI